MKACELTPDRKGFLWNTAAGLINAAEAVVILMAVTRVSGMEDAGIVTIAFSIGNLMMTIGLYGMRSYQVKDVRDVFSFEDYYSSRVVTVGFMLFATLCVLFYGSVFLDYSRRKSAVIFLICAIYMVESLENVFWGYYQRRGHLDYGGQAFTGRWLVQLAVVTGLLLAGQDLVRALFLALILGAAATVVYNRRRMRQFREEKPRFTRERVGALLRSCFPLFLTSFLSKYITDAPKYAIDALLSEDAQARYGFIAMPVFVVSLLSNFFYQPVLLRIAWLWQGKKLAELKRLIRRQVTLIAGLTVLCIGGAAVLGIPVLSLLYNTDLSGLRMELLVLLVGGGFLAVGAFMLVIMTSMRIQRQAAYAYGAVAAAALALSRPMIGHYGLLGAVWLYVGLEAALMIALFGMVWRAIRATAAQL